MCSYGHLAHIAFAMDDVIINILNICFDLTLTSRINNRVRSIMPQECSLCSVIRRLFAVLLFALLKNVSLYYLLVLLFLHPTMRREIDSLAPQKRMRNKCSELTDLRNLSFLFLVVNLHFIVTVETDQMDEARSRWR